jgi:prepilin-type N-terminal cleavage/methylation domain-containing protein
MRNLSSRGMTIIELLITMVIAGILGTGAFRLYVNFTKQNTYQKRVNELQHQVLAAAQFIEKDIRMAGFGLPGNGIIPTLSLAGNDSIAVFINRDQLQTTLVGSTSSGATSVTVNSVAGIKASLWICLNRSDTTIYRKIASIDSSGPHRILFDGGLPGSFPDGATVSLASKIEYSIDPSEPTFARVENGRRSPVGSAIDTFSVIARNAAGDTLFSGFEAARTVLTTLGGRVQSSGRVFPILHTVEVNIRNFH